MALPSIIKRGNPLYTIEYLVSGPSNASNQPLSNVTTIISADLANFGANVYVLNDVASSNAKLNEVDPINHTSLIRNSGYNAPTDMASFAITTTSYNSASNITLTNTDTWILVADYCNSQIMVTPRLQNSIEASYRVRDSNDSNTYIGPNILGIGPGSTSTQRNLLYIGTNGKLSNTTLRFTNSNLLRTSNYTEVNENSPILRIINSPTTNHFYFIAGSSPYTIRYGGLTGSSFTQLTNLPSWNELLDITFDPFGNLWFTSYTTNLAGTSTYTLKKYIFTNPSNGVVTYTKTLGSIGSGGTPVVDYIPTKGIVIADEKGNGYFGGCNSNSIQSVYITNPYYTY